MERRVVRRGRGRRTDLNSELPHGPHRHSWDGPKVVGGNYCALFGASHTRHALRGRGGGMGGG